MKCNFSLKETAMRIDRTITHFCEMDAREYRLFRSLDIHNEGKILVADLLNSFEQVESSSSRRFQGTGLGLGLTKSFVELHGGKIWAESEGVDQGSRFRFVIPVSQR